MEEEKFISGYCRQLDASRMVEVVAENGEIAEVDCCYGSCVYQGSCLIAKEIDEMNAGTQNRHGRTGCPQPAVRVSRNRSETRQLTRVPAYNRDNGAICPFFSTCFSKILPIFMTFIFSNENVLCFDFCGGCQKRGAIFGAFYKSRSVS